jgi:hypothetical protein
MNISPSTAVKNNVIAFLDLIFYLLLPPSIAARLQYFLRLRRFPNLTQPQTLTEKIQYRKLYDRDPRMPRLVDKILVKEFVRDSLGEDWIIPTVWSGKVLPPLDHRNWEPPYVLKANHGSGWNIFVYSKTPDWESIEKISAKWTSLKYKPYSGQWAYLEVEPALLVEGYIGNISQLPVDYKLFVFSGKVQFIQVDTDRRSQHQRVFFDRAWRRQDFTIAFPTDPREISPPHSVERMIWAAERISHEFLFVRVDFYEINGQPKFGEMTFYPESGLFRVSPLEYDRKLGGLWE